MPYIHPDDRTRLYAVAKALDRIEIQTCGELNYLITLCIARYMATHALRYQTINDIVGAVDGAKSEFYRRVAAPYEDMKIKENGDVY